MLGWELAQPNSDAREGEGWREGGREGWKEGEDVLRRLMLAEWAASFWRPLGVEGGREGERGGGMEGGRGACKPLSALGPNPMDRPL